ncbi:MAG TPA: ABC transporter permease [Candidatus Acidoferrales bacterium]|nr:ABC transporter permease [Candidatus Acidoferrales bacterium]
MRALRAWLLRFGGLFGRRRRDRELADEMESHLRMHIEDNLARGMTPAEARRQALIKLGGVEQTKETYRERRGIPFLETLLQDIRFAFRMLRKSPGFTAVAILTLALGIGANTAIFSLLDAFIFRTLPISEPSEVVEITGIDKAADEQSITIPIAAEIEKHQKMFSAMGAYWGDVVLNVDANGALGIADIDGATGTYYSVLGTKPVLGRLLTPDDVALEGGAPNHVVVISYDFWQQHFGGAADVVGKTIRIEKLPFTIIGVTPKNFFGMSRSTTTIALTIPLTTDREITASAGDNDDSGPLHADYIVARMRAGVKVEQVRAQLESLWPGILAETVPANLKPQEQSDYLAMKLSVKRADDQQFMGGRFSRPLYVLMALAGLILLIACVNLATLMLARAAARGHEMSVRVALGAGRWRLAQQLLVESVVLAIASALFGLLLASYGSKAIAELIARQIFIIPTTLEVGPDLHVLAFTALAAILTGVLFGLAPAWDATRTDPNAALQQNSRTMGATAGRFGKGLICAQVALSAVLLMGAGLFVHSLEKLNTTNPGYTKKNMLVVELNSIPGGYDNINDDSYYPELVRRISSLPGVESASTSQLHLGGGYEWTQPVSKVGSTSNNSFAADFATISPGFFRTVGMNVLEGRDFSWQDTKHAPAVAIVSRTLAQKLSPNGDAVGLHIRIGPEGKHDDVCIIGVVSDARIYDIHSANLMVVYIPGLQGYSQWNTLDVRSEANPLTLIPAIRKTVLSMGHEYLMYTKTLRDLDSRAVVQDQVTAMLGASFGGLALLLAAIGLFGLMSYNVTRRTRELGIRFALGAQRNGILKMILGEALALTLTGVAVGVPCALAATRLITHMLFGVTPYDPVTLAAVSFALLAVGALAGYIPARRAMRVDPMVALRHE